MKLFCNVSTRTPFSGGFYRCPLCWCWLLLHFVSLHMRLKACCVFDLWLCCGSALCSLYIYVCVCRFSFIFVCSILHACCVAEWAKRSAPRKLIVGISFPHFLHPPLSTSPTPSLSPKVLSFRLLAAITFCPCVLRRSSIFEWLGFFCCCFLYLAQQ